MNDYALSIYAGTKGVQLVVENPDHQASVTFSAAKALEVIEHLQAAIASIPQENT